jgi:hypothetical protein
MLSETPPETRTVVGTLLSWSDELGLGRQGPPDSVRERPGSTILRIRTPNGPLWLKAAGPGSRYEAALLAVLSRRDAPYTVLPLAVDEHRGFSALPHRGTMLRGTPANTLATWERLLAEHAALQRQLELAVPQLLAAGVNIALGSDGMSSNDGNDMYATLKVAGLLHKDPTTDYERWLGAREAWAMATSAGGHAMGDERVGRLTVGAHADLVLLDLDSLVFTPLNDPLNHVVFSSTATALRSTMVGGRWVLRDGRVTGVDEQEILAHARDLGRKIVLRHEDGFRVGRQLLESLRRGWLEAMRTDVGVERKLRR